MDELRSDAVSRGLWPGVLEKQTPDIQPELLQTSSREAVDTKYYARSA